MSNFSAGYSKNALPVTLPLPLAGHVTRQERLATWQRDPLEVTAVIVQSQKTLHAIVSVDMLIVDDALYSDAQSRLNELGITGLLLNATHTHSGIGGTIDARGIRYFMGKFRPEWRESLLDTISKTVTEARDDCQAVDSVSWGTATVPGITMNRRDVRSPGDDRVATLKMVRTNSSPILLFSTSGHPVIVSCNREEAASADYPGELRKRMSEQGYAPLFLPGALGGLNILFPEMENDLETHMRLVVGQLTDGLDQALEDAVVVAEPDVAFNSEPIKFQRRFPPTAMARTPALAALKGALFSTVGYLYSLAVSKPEVQIPVSALRIGNVVISGMPADFGVHATLDLRDRLKSQFGLESIVASHTNGYAGYVHLPGEYDWHENAREGFFLYENAMGWFGKDAGRQLNDATLGLFD